ncbi:DUF6236 family protein [Brucella pseudogrignonensis]|uniref:DUF6236 family protein n=1 Tax=Brucella pseudogrignonensis TaxID=419475 RepID=UPI003D96D869
MTAMGLIIGGDISFDCVNAVCSVGQNPEAFRQNLRRWSLFWDRLGVVYNANAIQVDHPEFEFLINSGLLDIYDVHHQGGELSSNVRAINTIAMDDLEKKETGEWAIDLSPGSLHAPHPLFRDWDTTPDRGILLQLHNVIPVPDKDVPLADILEFKEKRKTELLALRQHLDDLYLQIGNSHDPAFALNSKKNAIEQSANDAIKVMKEKFPFRMSSQAVNFNFLGGAAAAAGAFLAQSNLTTILSNFLISGVTIGAALEWKNRKAVGNPFTYVASYHDHLFFE